MPSTFYGFFVRYVQTKRNKILSDKGYLLAILINVGILLTFALAAFFIVQSVNKHGMERALEEAEQKAHMLMIRNLSTHAYFSEELKPSVFSAIKGKLPASYFDPRWMSSTFAIKGIDKRFKQNEGFENFYYK